MSHVFDSSSIYKCIAEGKEGVLGGNLTVEPARFELGNIVWKEAAIFGRITRKEALMLLDHISETLETMFVLGADIREVWEVAADTTTTFYDASYVWLARKAGATLVTEDRRLAEKASKIVATRSIEQIHK